MRNFTKLFLTTCLLAGFAFSVNAQTGVAINTDGSDPDSSAILDVSSTTKGFLLPRVTTAQMNAISSPAQGLMVYNTSVASPCTYDGSYWVSCREGKSCGNITYGGQVYTTVIIGTQCWMAQNLNIGTRIDGTSNQTDNSTIEKYCYADNTLNCATYGGLYQWNEMMQYSTTPGIQGICPTGWHLPTDAEWTTLTTYLGGESVAGGKMKETGTTHWASPNTGATNTIGFTALPGGNRHSSGAFNSISYQAHWWSSTEYSITTSVWYRTLTYVNTNVSRASLHKDYGCSVRCLKD